MFGIGTWLSGWDEFGSGAKFNYRGESGYGTSMGGFCSLLVTTITTLFIGVQLLGMVWPSYNQQSTTIYLGSAVQSTIESYDIQIGDLVPTFWVQTVHNKIGETPINVYNSPTYFLYQYVLIDNEKGTRTPVDAVVCSDDSYINGPFWEGFSQWEKTDFLKQLDNVEYQLCPDIEVYSVLGGFLNQEGQQLAFEVLPNPSYFNFEGKTDEEIADIKDRVDDTAVYNSMIRRYYEPTQFNDVGFMSFIGVTANKFTLFDDRTVQNWSFVSSDQIQIYSFPLLDTSAISMIDLSKKQVTYSIDESQTQWPKNFNDDNALFQMFLVQSRAQQQITWAINSLDLILGLVGGFTAIIWSSLAFAIGPYEEFKFNNSVVGSIYPTSPQRDEDEPPIDNSKDANEALEGTVIERGKFFYAFTEYQWTWIMKSCLCCLVKKNGVWWKNRIFKYTRYEKAVERMNEEIDILKHIQNQRVSEFMAKLILRKHQRALVSSFQKFQLDDMIAEHEAVKRRDRFLDNLANLDDGDDVMEVTQNDYANLNENILTDAQKELLTEIRAKFDPENVIADTCILYEITQYKDSSADDAFWDTYMDFFELGNDENLIRQDKLDLRALESTNRKVYLEQQTSQVNLGTHTARDGSGRANPTIQDPVSPSIHGGESLLSGD